MNRTQMEWIRSNGGKPAKTLIDLSEFYYNFYINRQENRPAHLPRGAGMHDPLAVAIAEDPTLATMEAIRGEIELAGHFTRGHLIADRRLIHGRVPNVRVCTDVKADEFMTRFCEAVVKL
ncbi:MAG: nucleoside hydrolase [Phycisphaeraceae bacterium]|nr:nucleoside hydrolase [Phycisphaeraceae bacterium]